MNIVWAMMRDRKSVEVKFELKENKFAGIRLYLLVMFDTYCRQQDVFQLLPEDVTILEGHAQHKEGTEAPAQGTSVQTVAFQFGVAA